MPDTIRTIAELNIILRDNEDGEVSPQDIRDMMISQMVHGEIGSVSKSPITLGTGWQTLDFDSAGLIHRGVILDAVNKRIGEIPVDLKAILTMEVIFKGTPGQTYEFTCWKNAGGTPKQVSRMARSLAVVTAAQTVSHSWSTAVQFAEDDTVEAAVKSNGNAFELLFGVLRLQRVGVE